MRKLIIISLVLFTFISCSSKGELKFLNRTEHNLYFSFKGNDYILAGDKTREFEFDTGNKFPFFASGEDKKISLYLEGETFMMQTSDQFGNPTGNFFTETEVYVKPEKTTKIYANPTHASIKIINNSSSDVTNVAYDKIYADSVTYSGNLVNLVPADSIWFEQMKAYTSDDSFSYVFTYEFVQQVYADTVLLGLDDQKLIEVE